MNKLKIGNKEFDSKIILAPMAGVTDSVLRCMVREYSSKTLLMTEMLASEAICMGPERSITFAAEQEYPLSFQLEGHKPDVMARAAKKIEKNATIIDINMGCPAPKIVKNGDGGALMRTPELAFDIISAVKAAVGIPVTVKTRLGWDNESKNYLEFAKMVEKAGADAIVIHGRTRKQMYSGMADWNAIAEIKNVLKIPVIANGDIDSVESAIECQKITNCDGMAIGRGILGDVGLISRVEHYFETGEILPTPDIKAKIEMAKIHVEREIAYRGELSGIRFARKFFTYYIRGFKSASQYRCKLVRTESHREILQLLDEIAQMSEIDALRV